jgi:hypothetical protein
MAGRVRCWLAGLRANCLENRLETQQSVYPAGTRGVNRAMAELAEREQAATG